MARIPIHPFIRVFELSTHRFLIAHIDQLELYQYDETIGQKLVIPEHKRELINILINASKEGLGDIIKGKSGGIIVLSSGPPGTGKTLTAEVFSEVARKPLYIVQCAQLGTDAEALEGTLSEALSRATLWNAVLLIDEADVYIHERGGDLEQNAIVGVFLRLLEYFSGILFLTTNRTSIIDDAIVSRLTAHVRYTLPTKEEQAKIWNILAEHYGINLHSRLIEKLTIAFPKISGRSIKQMLRLVKVVMDAKNTNVAELSMFEKLAEFQDMESLLTEEERDDEKA